MKEFNILKESAHEKFLFSWAFHKVNILIPFNRIKTTDHYSFFEHAE